MGVIAARDQTSNPLRDISDSWPPNIVYFQVIVSFKIGQEDKGRGFSSGGNELSEQIWPKGKARLRILEPSSP